MRGPRDCDPFLIGSSRPRREGSPDVNKQKECDLAQRRHISARAFGPLVEISMLHH